MATPRAAPRAAPVAARAARQSRAATRDDAADASAPRRRVVRRPTDGPSRRLSEEEKRARLEALRARDLALRAKPRVDALIGACARDETRRAQELKKEIVSALTIEAVPLDAHLALVSMYCRGVLPALAERAFADALRAAIERRTFGREEGKRSGARRRRRRRQRGRRMGKNQTRARRRREMGR